MTHIIVAARACLVHDNRLLLVSNDGSFWCLPGGHMEPREGLATCAKREVYEETGYLVDVGDILHVFEFYDKKWDSHKVECVFEAIVKECPTDQKWQDLGHDQSVTMQRWVSLEEIQAMDNIKPEYLKDGNWQKNSDQQVYCGYEQ